MLILLRPVLFMILINLDNLLKISSIPLFDFHAKCASSCKDKVLNRHCVI